MTLLISYVALALGVSFLCSIMEAVLLSISPSFVARCERENPRLSRKLRAHKDNIDRPLAAILSLNTIAHTVGAAGAGAQAAFVFGDAYIGLISAVLTILILFFSEIIPKTLGAVYWRQLTPVVVRLLDLTIWSMWPLVKISDRITRLLTHHREEDGIHREEFIALAEQGAEEGVFHEHESRILKNLFRLRQVRARDIMTPRTVVFALAENLSVAEVLSAYDELRFSRIPLFGESREQITGFALKSDILHQAARQHGDILLAELKRPLLAVPTTLLLNDLFERLVGEDIHIALILDEHGGTEGIATLEDVVETLLDLEIVDESDTVQDMQELARQRWKRRARRMGLIDEEGHLKT
jgi:CBS domain containing-hemolysin-like protein